MTAGCCLATARLLALPLAAAAAEIRQEAIAFEEGSLVGEAREVGGCHRVSLTRS